MAYSQVVRKDSDGQTRQILMKQGMSAGKIRIHPNRCNCRVCRRRFNLPKNQDKK